MSESDKQPTILVIVGITGDLSRRYLLPAIENLAQANMLPEQFCLIGVTRRDISAHEVADPEKYPFTAARLEMCQMDLGSPAEYKVLRDHVESVEQKFQTHAQRLFYLAVPPQVSEVVIRLIGEAGFGGQDSAKLLLEKPFGTDFASASALVEHIKQYFDEEHVYRIDHYLAKEMAQNLLVFRSSNSLFKRTWNKGFIERIEVLVAEQIGIEGRATFYEQTGALRDVLQSHVLQLAALTLMELPSGETWDEVPKQRLAALNSLQISEKVVRGQYKGYTEEVSNPHSTTETFVSLTLESSDERWQGVPITLTTGKALDKRCTEVCIHYRRENAGEANRLKLQIQPHEGIELELWSKRPGYGRELERVQLRFDYNADAQKLPDAYELVLLDAIRSDHSLFASSEEILAAWHLLDPVQRTWAMSGENMIIYEPGSSPESIFRK